MSSIIITIRRLELVVSLLESRHTELENEQVCLLADAGHWLALAMRNAGISRCACRSRGLAARITGGNHAVMAENCVEMAEQMLRQIYAYRKADRA